MKLVTRRGALEFTEPLVMGIVNLAGDSFSGHGLENTGQALQHARQLIAEGADIIDVGGESADITRAVLSAQEEIDRLGPFIEKFLASDCGATLLSINTWRPQVVRAALALGGDLLNDLSGLPTGENARCCTEHHAALIITHTVGEPKIPHAHPRYADVMATLDLFFSEKIALALESGLPRDALVLDPGIDFAKQREDNLRIYRELARLRKFHCPVLLPISRKRVIGEVLNIRQPQERDAGTIACLVSGALRGASIFRVHNVRAARQTLQILQAIRE